MGMGSVCKSEPVCYDAPVPLPNGQGQAHGPFGGAAVPPPDEQDQRTTMTLRVAVLPDAAARRT